MVGMAEFMVSGFILRLIVVVIALVVVWAVLRVLDRLTGVRFVSVYHAMATNPLGLGLYLGLRFIGACLLVGLLLS